MEVLFFHRLFNAEQLQKSLGNFGFQNGPVSFNWRVFQPDFPPAAVNARKWRVLLLRFGQEGAEIQYLIPNHSAESASDFLERLTSPRFGRVPL